MTKEAYFVAGIDTDIGKSIATGLLAGHLLEAGVRVTTQKLIQTGCTGIAEDILTHRRLMGIELTEEDQAGVTSPLVYPYPASPHLAARMVGEEIDLSRVTEATKRLLERYDTVLIECAGGLHVPLKEHYTTLDYIAEQGHPIVLVTSPRLGSINHTLLSLEACERRGIAVKWVIYNHYPEADAPIRDETRRYLQAHIARHHKGCEWLEICGNPPRLTATVEQK